MTKKLRYLSRVLPVLLAGAAYAQDANTSFQEPDRVVVTGSLIPTAEEVTAQNVQQVGTRDIQRSGSADVLTVLQKTVADITGAGNLGSSNANIASGSTQGGAIISIRGLPTLVLDEGRRIADSAAISTGGFQFSDVSLFPTSLVSRIEVLKDGASALYGSDAVGGVINIFLKHDYKGVEIGYRYGFTPESGNQNTLAWVIAGTGNDKTNVTVGYQYYQTDGLFLRERAYSNPTFGTTTYAGRLNQAGSLYRLQGGINSPFDVAGLTPGSQGVPPGNGGTAAGPFTGLMATAYGAPQSTGAIVAGFNLSNIPTSYLEENNQSAIASFTHQIFGKRLELFGDLLWSQNHNTSYLNGQPVTGGALYIPAGGVQANGTIIYNPFTLPYAPPGSILTTGPNAGQVATSLNSISNNNLRNRYIDYPRVFTNDTNFIRLLGGLRSQITNDYNFETAFYYSKYQITFRNSGLVNGNQLNAMIAGTATDFTGNAIPSLDFFAVNPIGTGPGQVSASQFATNFGTNIRYQESWQKVIDAKFTGFPFKLPAGPFGFAIGGEYRYEGFSVTDSPEIFIGSVPIQNINTARSIYSAYAELSIPLTSPQMKIPGLYSMDLSLAGRHDHYEGVSQDANVPKITLRWQPIQDLTLRAYYGNSFVAPNLYQLYGPASTGFSTPYRLPLSPTGPNSPNLQSQVVSGSNPNLVPSTAQNYGFGAVWSPKFAPGLTFSVDYFNVLQQNVVSTIGAVNIGNSVNRSGSASPYYNLVHINSFSGPTLAGGPNIPVGPPGFPAGTVLTGTSPYYLANFGLENVFIQDTNINIATIRVTGWDFSMGYTWDMKAWGTLQLGANAVLYVNNDFKRLPTQSYYISAKGFANTEGVGTTPQYRVNALLEYRYRSWSLGLNYNFIPQTINGATLDTSSPANYAQSLQYKVGAFSEIDIRAGYTFVAPAAQPAPKTVVDPKGGPVAAPVVSHARWYDGLSLAVGCNNLFNHQPPYAAGFNSNTDLSTFNGYGRQVYFQVAKKF